MSAGLIFGSLPAWQATRLDLNEVLRKVDAPAVVGVASGARARSS